MWIYLLHGTEPVGLVIYSKHSLLSHVFLVRGLKLTLLPRSFIQRQQILVLHRTRIVFGRPLLEGFGG